jgi:hypothetical protein
MSISERINPDNLNIHQFQEMPEGRPELPFDVYREITNEIKEKIDDALGEQQDKEINLDPSSLNDNELYMDFMVSYKTLWPDASIQRRLSDEELIYIWRRIQEEIIVEQLGQINYSIVLTLRSIIAYSPNIKIQLPWSDIESIIEDNQSTKFDISFWASVAVINPEWIEHITPEQLDHWRLKLEEFKMINRNKPNSPRLIDYCTTSANLRLIDPTYTPDITQEEWSGLSHELKIISGAAAVYRAKQMKIISAHSVKVTAPGVIDIKMYPPEDVNTSTPPVPEQRKF